MNIFRLAQACRALFGCSRFVPLLLYGVCVFFLCAGFLLPAGGLFSSLFHDRFGGYVGLGNLAAYLAQPGLGQAFLHTVSLGGAVTLSVLILAFIPAYALSRSRFPGKAFCRLAIFCPLFVPSLFPAMGLIYLFGNQGIISEHIGAIPLYGPLGIYLGAVIYTLPHAVLLLHTALRAIDPNLEKAAKTLGASALRRFWTIIFPGARYAFISAGTVCFILTITDFGIPKVLGGNYSMLATEIYTQVAGLQNFPMAATVSLLLLLPAVPVFLLDRWAAARQKDSQHPPVREKPGRSAQDFAWVSAAWLTALLPLCVIASAGAGAFIAFWPYELRFTLTHFQFHDSVYGVRPFLNSLKLGLGVAVLGTLLSFLGAYCSMRRVLFPGASRLYSFLALLPLGMPGAVLGLAYLLLCHKSGGAWHFLSGGLSILIINTVIHFYTVCHLNAVTGLQKLPGDYEAAGESLGVPWWRTFFRVILPLQKKTLRDSFVYLFVNAVTTISGVVFLYTPETIPASVACLHLLDAGRMAEASAMGVLILLGAAGLHLLLNVSQHLQPSSPGKNNHA